MTEVSEVPQSNFKEAELLIRWARTASQALGASSAEQIAASLMARAFISADISGSHAPLFTYERLATMANELVLLGQTIWQRMNGDIKWVQMATIAKRTGNYRISGRSFPPNRVMHCRLNVDMQSGMGRSDLEIAYSTRDFIRSLEKNLADEAQDSSGYVIPTEHYQDGDLKTLITNIEGAKLMAPPESSSFLQSPGQSRSAQYDWMQKRIGFAAPEVVRQWYESARLTALAVLGVPASLHSPVDASAMREGWRVYIFTVVDPISRLLEQAAARCGLELDMNFDRLMASDVQNRSRAYKQLVDANMDEDEARQFTGFGS